MKFLFYLQEDLNILGDVTLKDLVRILSNRCNDLTITYNIKKIANGPVSIPYVAEFVRVSGTLVNLLV
jgi:hypothetical protein